jgi:hypothetical protein
MERGKMAERDGIYTASKTRHAALWRDLRNAGAPIISTWIDEAGEGESADLNDLWQRCIAESCSCKTLIVYREPDDVLKGAWVEIGAALAVGNPVYAVGLLGFTISKYHGIKHFPTLAAAFAAAGYPACVGQPQGSAPSPQPPESAGDQTGGGRIIPI